MLKQRVESNPERLQDREAARDLFDALLKVATKATLEVFAKTFSESIAYDRAHAIGGFDASRTRLTLHISSQQWRRTIARSVNPRRVSCVSMHQILDTLTPRAPTTNVPLQNIQHPRIYTASFLPAEQIHKGAFAHTILPSCHKELQRGPKDMMGQSDERFSTSGLLHI